MQREVRKVECEVSVKRDGSSEEDILESSERKCKDVALGQQATNEYPAGTLMGTESHARFIQAE
jgi:hypothetical protein